MGAKCSPRQFAEIDGLCGGDWLVPGHFTGADGYALTFFRWGKRIDFDMARYPAWAALVSRALERPAVQRVLASEALDMEAFRP